MEKQTYEEVVLKVVMWWSEKSFHTPLNQNNGDESEIGQKMFMFANIVAAKAQESVTKEKQKAFESKLTELLMSCNKYEITLSVDYHPCTMLSEAAEFAGINSSCFPCKSHTRIDENNRAFAKYQYGNGLIEI